MADVKIYPTFRDVQPTKDAAGAASAPRALQASVSPETIRFDELICPHF
jgi:hypothetical protein